MGRNVRVAVDAMGGDNAPGEIVKGALEALKASKDLTLVVVGQQKPLERELKKYQYDKSRVEVVFATEVIEMAEPPVVAIRKKKDSSICVGLNMVKQSGRVCVIRQHRSGISRGAADRRQEKRGGAPAACADRTNGGRAFFADRLRGERGREIIAACAVCKNGRDLYGVRRRGEKPARRDCEYRRGG